MVIARTSQPSPAGAYEPCLDLDPPSAARGVALKDPNTDRVPLELRATSRDHPPIRTLGLANGALATLTPRCVEALIDPSSDCPYLCSPRPPDCPLTLTRPGGKPSAPSSLPDQA